MRSASRCAVCARRSKSTGPHYCTECATLTPAHSDQPTRAKGIALPDISLVANGGRIVEAQDDILGINVRTVAPIQQVARRAHNSNREL
eukprot:4836699-Prymnesium_polylepis.2